MDERQLHAVNMLIRRLGRAVQLTSIEGSEIRFTAFEQQFVVDCNLTCVEQIEGHFRVSSNWADVVTKMLGDTRNGSI